MPPAKSRSRCLKDPSLWNPPLKESSYAYEFPPRSRRPCRRAKPTSSNLQEPGSADLQVCLLYPGVMRSLAQLLLALAALLPLHAADSDRDFSGRWVLDPGSAVPAERLLTVVQNPSTIRCYSSGSDGSQIEWSYALNGDESRYAFGEESRNSVAKWEGA